MKALVTGGRGFLGTHVCAALQGAGHESVPLRRGEGDLAEPGTFSRLLGEHEPDVVIHLAAVLPGYERIGQNASIAELVATACVERDVPLFHGSSVEHGERGCWDVGRDDDLRSLEAVAALACAAADADESLIEPADPPPEYAPLIDVLDTDRLRSLGWRPAVALEDDIRSMLERLREAA